MLENRHVRPQGIVLKHHADVSLVGRNGVHFFLTEKDLALVGLVKAPNEPEDRRLSATGRAEKGEQLSVLDVEGNVAHRLQRPKAFHDIFESNIHSHHETVLGKAPAQSEQGLPPKGYRALLLFYNVLVFLSDLLAEIGVHVLHPLLLPCDFVVVDVSYRDIKEGPHASCKFNRFFLAGSRRTLDLVFRSDGINTQFREKLLSFLGQEELDERMRLLLDEEPLSAPPWVPE